MVWGAWQRSSTKYPRRNSRIGVEVRVERDVPLHVHGDGISSVNSSDQLVKLYLGVSTAISGILFNHCADIALAIAQSNRSVKT